MFLPCQINHQYRLTSEDGQPHKKRFTVTLNLGDEEYTSEEASIKKAQHSAAAVAIKKTNYKHPPIKVNRLPQRTSSQVGSLGKFPLFFCFYSCANYFFLNRKYNTHC